MTKLTVFVHAHGKPGIQEVHLDDPETLHDLTKALAKAGIETGGDLLVFVDEDEEAKQDPKSPVKGLKHGSRVHVSRCRQVKTAVHFLERTVEREFAPGTRVKTVKEWAVREFKLNPKDAGEHVLQLCKSDKQPPTDTTLAELTDGHTCSVCFNLVPEKRVEG
jgi:hypothetical protein